MKDTIPMISSQLIPGLRLPEVVRTVVAGIKAFQKTIGKGLLRTFLREDKQRSVKHKAEIMGRKVGHLRQGPWRCSLNARGLDTCTSCLMSYSPTYIDNTVKALWLNHWHHGLNSYVYFNVLIILNGKWITVDFSLLLMGTSCFVWTLGWGQGLSPQGAGIIQKVLSENMLQQTEGKRGRACYCGGEQWHNLIDCGFLWVPWLLLNNPECDRLASGFQNSTGADRSFFRAQSFSPRLLWRIQCYKSFWVSWGWWIWAYGNQPSRLCRVPQIQHSWTLGAVCWFLADVEIPNCSNPGNKSFWEWHCSSTLATKLIPELFHR